MNKAIFLDRDGVLNMSLVEAGVSIPPRKLADFRLLPGVEEATRKLSEAGLRLVVVTNQPDIARGTLDPAVLDAIHSDLQKILPLDAIECCPHDDADGCECRKPKPGMILRAAERFTIDLGRSFVVGDRWRDIAAGRAAGCRTIYVSPSPADRVNVPADAVYDSLLDATDEILSVSSTQSS